MTGLPSDYLIALARLKTVESRAALAETISDLFSDKGDFLTDRERASMSSILHKIVGDIEGSLRRTFCDALATTPEGSPEIADALRTGDVAYRMLSRSPALKAEDLIEIVRHRHLEHRLMLALKENRERDPLPSSAASGGRATLVETFLHHAETEIARATMDYLLEQAKRVDSTHEPIVRREELAQEPARRTTLWIAAALRQHVLQHHDLDEMLVDEIMESVVSAEVAGIPEVPARGRADALADVLAQTGRLEPALLLASLAEGEVALAIALFARVTGLRSGLTRRLLFEPGGEGLGIACRAVGIPADAFSRLFALSRMARPQLRAQIRIDTRKAEAFYEFLHQEQAIQVLRKWRLRPDYAAAVRGVQLAATVSP
ncbi:MAG: DUF2336 domain-containing protein [Rhodospirillales bacterium]